MPSRVSPYRRFLREGAHPEGAFCTELPAHLSKAAGGASQFLHRHRVEERRTGQDARADSFATEALPQHQTDRKSTRLNSSHQIISYAVFCLKKKKKQTTRLRERTY